MIATNFKHKGIAISVTDGGEFKATVNGIEITAGSLITIRKKIDKASPFESFQAFTVGEFYNENEIKTYTIVGVKKDRGRNSHEFITSTGRTIRWVYRATKENLARAEKYIALKKKHEKMSKDHDKLESKAKEAIGEQVDADDLIKERSSQVVP